MCFCSIEPTNLILEKAIIYKARIYVNWEGGSMGGRAQKGKDVSSTSYVPSASASVPSKNSPNYSILRLTFQY